jgi:hypothetical protein
MMLDGLWKENVMAHAGPVLLLAILLILPSGALAQTTGIAGRVTDASGAVFPASLSKRRAPSSSSGREVSSPMARGYMPLSICGPAPIQ